MKSNFKLFDLPAYARAERS